MAKTSDNSLPAKRPSGATRAPRIEARRATAERKLRILERLTSGASVANIARVKPDVIATGNIGCITQIAAGTATPIVHTAELLDWASGGPKPGKLEGVG